MNYNNIADPYYKYVHVEQYDIIFFMIFCSNTHVRLPGVHYRRVPYSWKISRDPIFAVFTVDWQTTKIKSAK